MTGGPWTRSMKVVHGPGPKCGSLDQGSMFCPHPHEINVLNRIGFLRHAANKFHKLIDIPHV